MIEVKVIAVTPNPINVLYTAAKTCYSSENPQDIFDNHESLEDKLKLITKVIGYGHTSILEHVSVSFVISGVSRALSHQIVRHRHCIYSQKSQRYCNEGTFDYVTPESITNSQFSERYKQLMTDIGIFYRDMSGSGIPNEDARFILPNACETSFTVSMNLKEFIYICGLRLCSKAQWEIRDLVGKMKDELLSEHAPERYRECNFGSYKDFTWLEPYLQPKCVAIGRCTEKNSCGFINKKESK